MWCRLQDVDKLHLHGHLGLAGEVLRRLGSPGCWTFPPSIRHRTGGVRIRSCGATRREDSRQVEVPFRPRHRRRPPTSFGFGGWRTKSRGTIGWISASVNSTSADGLRHLTRQHGHCYQPPRHRRVDGSGLVDGLPAPVVHVLHPAAPLRPSRESSIRRCCR